MWNNIIYFNVDISYGLIFNVVIFKLDGWNIGYVTVRQELPLDSEWFLCNILDLKKETINFDF